MQHSAINFLLDALLAYVGLGWVFAGLFQLLWLSHFDHSAQTGSWGFRLIILPGLIALWPWLLPKVWPSLHHQYLPPLPERPVPPRILRAAHGWAMLILAIFLPILAITALKRDQPQEVIPFDSQLVSPPAK